MTGNEDGIRIRLRGEIVKFLPIEFWLIPYKYLSISPSAVHSIKDLQAVINDFITNRSRILQDLGTHVSITVREGDSLRDMDIPSEVFLDELIHVFQAIIKIYGNKADVEIEIIS